MATAGRKGPGSARRAPAATNVASLPDVLAREMELLGLSPYAARVLLALMALGSANSTQLARLSGVPRTSVYPVLDELEAKRVVERLPGDGPGVWAAPTREEVLARLEALEEERLREYRARTARLRDMLADALPQASAPPLPYVHLLRGSQHVRRAYEKMVGDARSELMMFTRPPYAWKLGRPNRVVVAALARGIRARVLYQASHWADPEAGDFRTEMDAYHRAGVQPRLAEELPIKLVVVDRWVTLVGMNDPVTPDTGYPTTLLVEHAGYAAVSADAFEQRWAAAQPLTSPVDGGRPLD